MRLCTLCACIVFQSHGGWGSLSDPAQSSSSSLSGLAAPSLGPLSLLSKLQSSLKNKEPLGLIRLSRQTPHRQCVTNSTLTRSWIIFSTFFVSFFFYQCLDLWRIFTIVSSFILLHSLFYPPPPLPPSTRVFLSPPCLLFCFSVSHSLFLW